MTDNFNLIEPLLDFSDADSYYFVQVLQRKKDAKEGDKVNGTNNNSRLIKAYYVKSKEYLDFVKPEIIALCKLFNARAGINLNRRSWEKTALQHLKLVADNIINKNYDKVYKTYSSAAGKFSHDNNKKWIVDVDKEELPFLGTIKLALTSCEPNIGVSKVIVEIPSKTGMHLITTPFNRMYFPKVLNDLLAPYQLKNTMKLNIQQNNPTNLYCP
jgi:hypothetical protein